jgi:hypothetical protein
MKINAWAILSVAIIDIFVLTIGFSYPLWVLGGYICIAGLSSLYILKTNNRDLKFSAKRQAILVWQMPFYIIYLQVMVIFEYMREFILKK